MRKEGIGWGLTTTRYKKVFWLLWKITDPEPPTWGPSWGLRIGDYFVIQYKKIPRDTHMKVTTIE